MANLPPDRSPVSVAWARASQVTTISLEMVVPVVLGYFADQWLKTGLVFMVIGAIAGLCSGMLSLLRFAGSLDRDTKKGGKDGNPSP